MEDKEIIDSSHSLLVSDSNEISQQFDSKKLDYSLLVNLVQDELFSRYLNVMSGFLLRSRFSSDITLKNESMSNAQQKWNQIKSGKWSGKYKAVNGQVILIAKEKIPMGVNPQNYVERYWEVPNDCQLVQIGNCMLRGMTEVINHSIQQQSKTNVYVNDQNMPPHMHNSSITSGSGILSISNTEISKNGIDMNAPQVDVFYDDSNTVGLSKNELDGTVDKFQTQKMGKDGVAHNNIPSYSEFYAFEVKSI